MKPRQFFIDIMKRTTATVTADAMFVGATGITLANPPTHERQKSELHFVVLQDAAPS
jgi:hypothetical protein